MPAGSEPVALPRTWRPTGPRIAGVVFGLVLVAGFVGLWYSFDDYTRSLVSPLQRATVIFFVGVGLACLYALGRSRVTAADDGLTVVNGFRRRTYTWPEVVAVRMPPGAPWPTLDLADGTTVPVMGIHQSDGGPSRRAVKELKSVLAANDASA